MVKIKRTIKYSIFIIIGLIFLINPLVISALEQNVYDEAKLFTINENSQLSNLAIKIEKEYEMDIVIVTINDSQNKSSRDFADNFYEANYLVQNKDKSGILFLIDLDNQEAYIATFNKAIKYITDSRQKDILDSVFANGIDDRNYFQASQTFLLKSQDYLKKGIPILSEKDETSKNKNSLSILEAGISVGLGAIISGLFYKRAKSSYKVKNPIAPNNLKTNSKTNFNVSQDLLINSQIESKVISKSTNDETDIKSSTHTSKNGNTFGGSGKKI